MNKDFDDLKHVLMSGDDLNFVYGTGPRNHSPMSIQNISRFGQTRNFGNLLAETQIENQVIFSSMEDLDEPINPKAFGNKITTNKNTA